MLNVIVVEIVVVKIVVVEIVEEEFVVIVVEIIHLNLYPSCLLQY